MSNRAILSADPAKRKKVFYAEEDGKTYVQVRQDCEGIIDYARRMAERPDIVDENGVTYRYLGEFPDYAADQALREGWYHDKARIRAWLNDRDNRAFNGGRDHVS